MIQWTWNYCDDVERLIGVEVIVGSVKGASRVNKVAASVVIVWTVDGKNGRGAVGFPNVHFSTRRS